MFQKLRYPVERTDRVSGGEQIRSVKECADGIAIREINLHDIEQSHWDSKCAKILFSPFEGLGRFFPVFFAFHFFYLQQDNCSQRSGHNYRVMPVVRAMHRKRI